MAEEEEDDLDESLLEVNDRSDVRGAACGDAAWRMMLRMLTDLAALNDATEEIIMRDRQRLCYHRQVV